VKTIDTRRIFFGVDPGTNITGYGVIQVVDNTVHWIDSGTVTTGRNAPLPEKLAAIFEQLSEKITLHTPCTVCVEQAFYAKNVHTTLILGHARGVILLAAHRAGAGVMEYSPREIKKAVVGNGNAAKEQVSFMVKALLAPPPDKAQADACDALATALCGYYNDRPLGAANPLLAGAAAKERSRGVPGRRRGRRRA
jgi:crossover junction endodeoxyribonuclease RuvC